MRDGSGHSSRPSGWECAFVGPSESIPDLPRESWHSGSGLVRFPILMWRARTRRLAKIDYRLPERELALRERVGSSSRPSGGELALEGPSASIPDLPLDGIHTARGLGQVPIRWWWSFSPWLANHHSRRTLVSITLLEVAGARFRPGSGPVIVPEWSPSVRVLPLAPLDY